ncbi:hypothetical protein QWY85_15920 [Neolewinella lacunae]|uniref:Uncharacterized protein n=1 Tax=Neolewinella lacunae TaxID=1517758 RepID=A0A923PGC3_9BACT|nr:hypothetical protein [Neolewinella lacunae]MBC6993570.1 hypothetical protein [Neolewinella lacunae]MDN3636155.1 hypothetical protein [Neolewinella lacunae]
MQRKNDKAMFERRRNTGNSRSWTRDEESVLLTNLRYESFDINTLQELFPYRSKPSIRSKVRKFRIKHDLFGSTYRDKKQDFTRKCAELILPKTVFEAYAGAGHQTVIWSEYASKIFASDKLDGKLGQFTSEVFNSGFSIGKKSNKWTQFNSISGKEIVFYEGDALDAAVELKYHGFKVDVLDLDTCGSTLPLLPILVALTKPKYLLITHGEFHSVRFGRDDVLRRVLVSRNIQESSVGLSVEDLKKELDRAVKLSTLRSHNETSDSAWAELIDETWLGKKGQGLLRRLYKITKPQATSDCLNSLMV